MNVSTSALRELHRIHRQLADLRERLDRGPKQLAAVEASVRKLETDVQQTKEASKKLRIHADEKQLQLKEREMRIQHLQGQLNACGTNREYQTLKEQIAADEQANSVLADEILEALERLDELMEKAKVAEETLQRARQESEKTNRRVADEQQALHAELARVKAELDLAETALPADFRRDYARIAKSRGEQTLAPVEGDCCGNCFRLLSTQVLNELFLSRPVFCKSCGSLLYFAEDRSFQKE